MTILGGRDLLTRFWSYMNILSIDVALGTLAGAFLVARVVEIEMSWSWYFSLSVTVWLIYTLDHLMDARKLGANAHTDRHLFHHQYFGLIGTVWFLAAASLAIVVIAFLPIQLIFFGISLGLVVAGYFASLNFIRSKNFLGTGKEMWVGLVYTLGIWGGPFFMDPDVLELQHVFLAAQFMLLALANLFLFSLMELNSDVEDDHPSFTVVFGEKITRRLVSGICLLLGLSILFALVFFGGETLRSVQFVYLLMTIVFAFILAFPTTFKMNAMYRMLGDGVFLFPMILLFL